MKSQTRVALSIILALAVFAPKAFAQAAPVLTLDKTADVAFFSVAGDAINYDYLVTASEAPTPGPITVDDDRVTVTCPAVSTVGNNDDNLDPLEALTCTASYAAVVDDIIAGEIINIATASGNAGGTVSNQDTVRVPYVAPGTPVLTLVVTPDPSEFRQVGELIDYSYLVSSTGNAPLIGPITVADSLMTVTCPPVDSVGNNDGILDVGESLVCTSSHVTTMTDREVGFVENTSTASDSRGTSSAPVDTSVPYAKPAIPTLSQWSLVLLSFLFLLMGVAYVRKSRAL